jgi:hypothetical protein
MFHFHRRKPKSVCLPYVPFTGKEMEQLIHFREHFVRTESDIVPPTLEQQRLSFARWLFVTGKLTEDVFPVGRQACEVTIAEHTEGKCSQANVSLATGRDSDV